MEFELEKGKVTRIKFLDGEPQDLNEYKKHFDFEAFRRSKAKLKRLQSEGYTGTFMLADKSHKVRVGGGSVTLIRAEDGQTYVFFPVRTKDAPRGPGMIDAAAGVLEQPNIMLHLLYEGIEEVLQIGIAVFGRVVTPIFVVKRFGHGEKVNEYNDPLERDVKELAERLGYGNNMIIMFADSRILAQENGSISIAYQLNGRERQYNNVIYSFEPESIELIVLIETKLPKGISMNDFVLRDAEFFPNGMPIDRVSILINTENGDVTEFHKGELTRKMPLKQWLDLSKELEKTGGRYATVKVASVIANNPQRLKRLSELLKGYPEYEKAFM